MSKLKKAAEFLIYAILVVLLGEAGFRLCLPFKEKRTRYFLTREVFQYNQNNVHFDPELGFFNNSNLNIRFDSPEFKTRITTNSRGFRDDEKSLSNPAILLLGDSFGFGWGAENNKTCADFLEKLTGRKVLNMSVSGFGTIQEFLLLRRFCESRDVAGKTAIFLFCPNDLGDNIGHPPSPYPTLYPDEDGSIHYRKASKNDFDTWLVNIGDTRFSSIYRYSYLAYGMRTFVERIKMAIKKEGIENLRDEKEMARVFGLLSKNIKSFSCDKEMDVVFVYIPMDYVLQGNDERTFNLIKAYLDENNIPLLDLREVLREEDYWRYDDHWRESGHFKTASAIKDFLEKNKFLE